MKIKIILLKNVCIQTDLDCFGREYIPITSKMKKVSSSLFRAFGSLPLARSVGINSKTLDWQDKIRIVFPITSHQPLVIVFQRIRTQLRTYSSLLCKSTTVDHHYHQRFHHYSLPPRGENNIASFLNIGRQDLHHPSISLHYPLKTSHLT